MHYQQFFFHKNFEVVFHPFNVNDVTEIHLHQLAIHFQKKIVGGGIFFLRAFPLIVLVDDADFAAQSLRNFLWTTFTRSNPAADVHGVDPFVWRKHWGCRGPLVIDARAKPHHAPPLREDPVVTRRVDGYAAPGGPLHGLIA